MGFDTDIFVQQPVDDNFICQICLDVQQNPTTVCKNGHTYCSDCIQQASKKNSNCPGCRSKMSKTNHCSNIPLRNVIMRLQVQCPRKEEQQQATIQSSKTSNKRKTTKDGPSAKRRRICCDKATTAATTKNSSFACSWQGTLEDYLENHSVRGCHFIKKTCSFCKALFRLSELEKHQETQCPNRLVKCNFCREEMTAHLLETQRTTCPEKEIECKHCGDKVLTKYMGRVDCEGHCSGHMALCKKLKIPCHGCKATLARDQMKDHLLSHAAGHVVNLNATLTEMKENKIEGQELKLNWTIPRKLINEISERKFVESSPFMVGNVAGYARLEIDTHGKVHLVVKLNNLSSPPSIGQVLLEARTRKQPETPVFLHCKHPAYVEASKESVGKQDVFSASFPVNLVKSDGQESACHMSDVKVPTRSPNLYCAIQFRLVRDETNESVDIGCCKHVAVKKGGKNQTTPGTPQVTVELVDLLDDY